MRYVVDSFTPNVRRSHVVHVVERVFVNAGSRQYSTVECEMTEADFRDKGSVLNKLMLQGPKPETNILEL